MISKSWNDSDNKAVMAGILESIEQLSIKLPLDKNFAIQSLLFLAYTLIVNLIWIIDYSLSIELSLDKNFSIACQHSCSK